MFEVGIDEVGRGSLAGPVVAVSLAFHTFPKDLYSVIDDSKKLSKNQRLFIYQHISNYAHIGVGLSTVEEIDTLNILQATFLAMKKSIKNLSFVPSHLFIDGVMNPNLPYPTTMIPQGDQKCLQISAASIVAKVTRDSMMDELHLEWPMFYWNKNKGYGTQEHLKALYAFGPSPYHRKSFAPCVRALNRQKLPQA